MYDELNPLTQKVEVKCFVLFTAVASATRAQTALNGRSFGGRRVQWTVPRRRCGWTGGAEVGAFSC